MTGEDRGGIGVGIARSDHLVHCRSSLANPTSHIHLLILFSDPMLSHRRGSTSLWAVSSDLVSESHPSVSLETVAPLLPARYCIWKLGALSAIAE